MSRSQIVETVDKNLVKSKDVSLLIKSQDHTENTRNKISHNQIDRIKLLASLLSLTGIHKNNTL